MPSLGWLDVTNISFNALLLLEPLHLRCIAERKPSQQMGTALAANPAVQWYLAQTYPPITDYIGLHRSLPGISSYDYNPTGVS